MRLQFGLLIGRTARTRPRLASGARALEARYSSMDPIQQPRGIEAMQHRAGVVIAASLLFPVKFSYCAGKTPLITNFFKPLYVAPARASTRIDHGRKPLQNCVRHD